MLLGAGSAWALTKTEVAKLTASDAAAGDWFGYSVALAGDTAIIGAHRDANKSGSAYVFTRTGTTWAQQAKLTASDGTAGDQFGVSAAQVGDTAVIGASWDDDAGSASGSAYVFIRTGTTWEQQAKLTTNDAAAFDLFGRSVALVGDTAVISAPGDAGSTGSAYVFTRTGTSWTQQAKLTASDSAALDYFGFPVALTGNTAVIGASRDDDAGSASGSAYVFTRTGTTWAQQAKLTASDGAAGDQFGHSVALAGDTAVIGAPGDASSPSSAYVFIRTGTSWTQQAKLTASDAATGDQFGFSIALAGDTAVIGAFADDDAGSSSGSAYLFTRTAGIWTQQAKLTASDAAAFDVFSYSVALAGDAAVIGAFRDSDAGGASGSAYVFLLSDNEGPVTYNVTANPNPAAINTPIGLMATVDDSATGGANIASAAYTIDGDTGSAMGSSDESFDEVSEAVEALIPSFTEAGVHDVCVSGIDAAGNTGAEECIFLAVYDPTAGFVTGGGWIDSEAGWCQLDAACAGAEGKATFGFVSKYQKGANGPTGHTEFQFKAGGLNFRSDTYQWLVVNQGGSNAQYKGTGTINGAGEYKFMIWAGDGSPDTFRIKIWTEPEEGVESVVYENQMDQAIGGGSIVIHTKGK